MVRHPLVRLLAGSAVMALSACPAPSTTQRSDSRGVITGSVELAEVPGLDDLSRVRVDLGRGEGGVTPQDDGSFSFSDVEPDVYTLAVTYVGGLRPDSSRSGYRRLETRVVLRAGGSVHVGVLRPARGEGTVRGTVVGAAGASVDGAVAVLRRDDGREQRSPVENGGFTLTGVPVGVHALSVQGDGLAVASTAAGCAPAVEMDGDGGEVTLSGLALARATATLLPAQGEVAMVDGSTWTLKGRDSVVVRMLAAYARRGRAWPAGTDAPPFGPISQENNEVVTFQVTGLEPGKRTWMFQVADGCGFVGDPVALELVRDTGPPTLGTVLLEDGAPTAASSVVRVLVPAADEHSAMEMRLDPCHAEGTWTCMPGAWEPHRLLATLALPGGDGMRGVEVHVRDMAGWGTPEPARASIRVRALVRPRPVLSGLGSVAGPSQPMPRLDVRATPRGDAVSMRLHGVDGTGLPTLAEDTVAIVGALTLPCRGAGDAASCASGAMQATCLSSCDVQLPASLLRASGSHTVQLLTPDPVEGGLGISDATLLLNVVAEAPRVHRVGLHGYTQLEGAGGALLVEERRLAVCGNFLDNASFMLGGVVGFTAPLDQAWGDASTCPAPLVGMMLDFGPVAFPLGDGSARLVVRHAAPGGGEAEVPVGINPWNVSCGDPCVVPMPSTRTSLHAGATSAQGLRLPAAMRGATAWTLRGADALAFRSGAAGMVDDRVAPGPGGVVVPPPFWDGDVVLQQRALNGEPVRMDRTRRGAGTWTPAQRNVPGSFRSPEALDLDGNGRWVVVVARTDVAQVAILEDWGGGPVVVATLNTTDLPVRVAPWDVNRDGVQDLLVSTRAAGTDVFLNQGGTLRLHRRIPRPFQALADLDRDGLPELLGPGATRLDANLVPAETTGLLADARMVLAGDFNGDGFPDAVGITEPAEGPTLTYAFCHGTLECAHQSPVRLQPPGVPPGHLPALDRSAAVGDFDADGAEDLAVPLIHDDHARVAVAWSMPVYALPMVRWVDTPEQHVSSVAVTDLDHDGTADILLAGSRVLRLTLRRGVAGGPAQEVLAAASTELLVTDVDRNGTLDLVTTLDVAGPGVAAFALQDAAAPDPSPILRGPVLPLLGLVRAALAVGPNNQLVAVKAGKPLTVEAVASPPPAAPRSMATADITGDGLPDLVLAAEGPEHGTVRVYRGVNGNPPFVLHATVLVTTGVGGTPPFLRVRQLHPLDADADGDTDLVAVAATAAEELAWGAYLIRNDAGTLVSAGEVANLPDMETLAVADMDGDGVADLVVNGARMAHPQVLTGSGGGNFAAPVDLDLPGNRVVVLADVNQDALLDVLTPDGWVAGSTTRAWARLDAPFSTLNMVGPAVDLDGDHLQDLLFNDGTVRLQWGNGAWGPPSRLPPGMDTTALVAMDLDDDDVVDVLSANGALAVRYGTAVPSEHVVQLVGSTPGDDVQGGYHGPRPGRGLTMYQVTLPPAWLGDVEMTLGAVADASGDPGLGDAEVTVTPPAGGPRVFSDGVASEPGCQRGIRTVALPFSPLRRADLRASACAETSLSGWMPGGTWTVKLDRGEGAPTLTDLALRMGAQHQRAGLSVRVPAAPTLLPLGTHRPATVTRASTYGAAGTLDISTACGAASNRLERTFQFNVEVPSTLDARVDATFDSVLAVLAGPCTVAPSLACNDNASGSTRSSALDGISLQAGTHCLVVDTRAGAAAGDFTLHARLR